MVLHTRRHFAMSRPRTWGRLIACLLFAPVLALSSPSSPKQNPPNLPLSRETPRIYILRAHIKNKTHSIGWPLLPQTNWCKLDVQSIRFADENGVQIPFDVEELATNTKQWRLTPNSNSYSIAFNAMAYSSVLDEEEAIKISWPESWGKEMKIYLQPSRFIESNDEIFKKAVADNGEPKSVPIHIAAKILIRYTLMNIESTGRYSHIANNVTTGIDVKGARYAVKKAKGSAADLVCVCVATLRAAGIPARPVVGITDADTVGTTQIDPQYIVWGEYALPETGWVPFFPERMRGTVEGLSKTAPWHGLGSLPWLNRRVPLAWNFDCFDVDRSTQNLQMNLSSSPN